MGPNFQITQWGCNFLGRKGRNSHLKLIDYTKGALVASPVYHKHAIKPVWGSHPPSWNPSLSTRFESLPTIIGNAEQPSGGGPVMGTGPQGDQLPRTQRSVNSSVQTNSQSSGVAGQACVCSSVCVERMKKKKRWGGLGLKQARSRGLQDYWHREADLIASLGAFSCFSFSSITPSAFRAQPNLWIDKLCDAPEDCDAQECGKSSHSLIKASAIAAKEYIFKRLHMQIKVRASDLTWKYIWFIICWFTWLILLLGFVALLSANFRIVRH